MPTQTNHRGATVPLMSANRLAFPASGHDCDTHASSPNSTGSCANCSVCASMPQNAVKKTKNPVTTKMFASTLSPIASLSVFEKSNVIAASAAHAPPDDVASTDATFVDEYAGTTVVEFSATTSVPNETALCVYRAACRTIRAPE